MTTMQTNPYAAAEAARKPRERTPVQPLHDLSKFGRPDPMAQLAQLRQADQEAQTMDAWKPSPERVKGLMRNAGPMSPTQGRNVNPMGQAVQDTSAKGGRPVGGTTYATVGPGTSWGGGRHSMARADEGSKIQGFSRRAAGLPEWGGLAEGEAIRGSGNPAFYQGSQGQDSRWSAPEITENFARRTVQPQAPQLPEIDQANGNYQRASRGESLTEDELRKAEEFAKAKGWGFQRERGYIKQMAGGGALKPGRAAIVNEEEPEYVLGQGGLEPIGDGRPSLMRAREPVEVIPLDDIENFHGVPNARQARTALSRSFQGRDGAERLAAMALSDTLAERKEARAARQRREDMIFADELGDQDTAERNRYNELLTIENRGYAKTTTEESRKQRLKEEEDDRSRTAADKAKLTAEEVGYKLAGSQPLVKEYADKGFIGQDQLDLIDTTKDLRTKAAMVESILEIAEGRKRDAEATAKAEAAERAAQDRAAQIVAVKDKDRALSIAKANAAITKQPIPTGGHQGRPSSGALDYLGIAK